MVTAKVGGQEISLYLGMKAVNAITAEYGSLRGLMETLSSENEAAQNEATFFVAFQLHKNAALLEKKEAVFDDADEMEASCHFTEWMPLFGAVCRAIKEDTAMTIEADVVVGESKNALATQGTE